MKGCIPQGRKQQPRKRGCPAAGQRNARAFSRRLRCAGIHHSAHSVRGREPLPAHAPAELTVRMHMLYACKECGGSSVCPHLRQRSTDKECGSRTSARASARGSDEGKCNEAADYADSSTVWRTVAQPRPRASPWSIGSWEALTHNTSSHTRRGPFSDSMPLHAHIHTHMHACIHTRIPSTLRPSASRPPFLLSPQPSTRMHINTYVCACMHACMHASLSLSVEEEEEESLFRG